MGRGGPTRPYRAGIGWTSFHPGPCPQLVWPQDRAWVVASEIDWDSTIVAGSRSLVDDVFADETLETFEVDEEADRGGRPRPGRGQGRLVCTALGQA